MIKQFTFSVFLIGAVSLGSFAQSYTDLQEAAQKFAQANLEEDFETVLDFTYPYVLEKSGGREALKTAMADVSEFQKEQGMKLDGFEIGSPSEINRSSDEVLALIPLKTITKVPHGELVNQNTLIAIFDQDKNQWYFIETSAIDATNIHGYVPSWDNTLGLSFETSMTFVSN